MILFLALSAASEAQERREAAPPERPVFFTEPEIMQRGFDLLEQRMPGGGEPRSGFYLETGQMITGAGWLSAGPGYRHFFVDRRVRLDTSAALSWRMYKVAQASLEVRDVGRRGVTIGSQVILQDMMQITYFGAGTETLESDRSEYRLTSSDFVGFASFQPRSWLTLEGRLGIVRPNLKAPAGPFSGDYPDARLRFPGDPGMTLGDIPTYTHGGVSIVADTRDQPGYPMDGGLYRAAWTRYNDRDQGEFSFDRYELEAARFIPMVGRRSVLALRGWTVLTPSGQSVPFYLMPSMGGDGTLRGYLNYRFHEKNMLVLNAESRWALSKHVDGAFFVEAGDVVPRAGNLGIGRKTFGFGLRLHRETGTLVRLDLGHGRDGWHFLFRTSDPFRFKRFEQRHALLPFVPK
jgi:outer membrane protein assembly factor BamA